MNLESAILAVLLDEPMAAVDIDEPYREDRIGIMATSINYAGNRAACVGVEGKCLKIGEPIDMSAKLIVQAKRESALASNVHRGECRRFECDPVKYHGVTIFRARSPWQLHRNGMSDEKWASIQGATLVATSAAAWETAKMFAGGTAMCHSTAGAFGLLATGHECTSKQSTSRAAEVERVKARLWALTHEVSK